MVDPAVGRSHPINPKNNGSPAAAAGEQAPNIDAQLACDAISGWCPA
jgi:hypothetical protein